MSEILLEQFEEAIRRRKPKLADSLRRGLAADNIRKMLHDAGVKGRVESIVSLYSWKNGCRPAPGTTIGNASLFPQSIYTFGDLTTMIEHFVMFHEGFAYHPMFKEVDGRYFPIFWDNSNGYIAVDLRSSTERVVLLDPESEELARKSYGSFMEFLKDAIRANEEDEVLICFQEC